ncbi:MAG: LysR family transcriptional regulator [Anaerolineae bacterium]|nr:LysR family transcriptional regulator [Anaerolineae bacterium]
MELHHLRTFLVVAEEQNVTRAAKRLYMTPPAVSAHIKALEEELNITLFVRVPQGMQITEKGALLREKASHILQAAQDLVNHATQMQDYLIGRMTIGLNAPAHLLRVAPLVAQMKEACPGIELRFMMSVSGIILDKLQTNALDAGFIFGSSPYDDVLTMPLSVVELVIAVPKQWEAQLERATWADVACLPWIASTAYCPFQVIIEDQFRQRGLIQQQIVQSDDETTKVELVEAGVGLALLERTEAEEAAYKGNLVVWTHDLIQTALCFAVAKNRTADPLVMALKSQVLALWNNSASGTLHT